MQLPQFPVKFAIPVLALIVAVVLGIFLYKPDDSRERWPRSIERNLTVEDRNKLEQELAVAENLLGKTEKDYRRDKYRALTDKGAAQFSLGELDRAEDTLKSALGLVDDESTAYTGIFKVQWQRGNLKDARTNARKGIDERPSDENRWVEYINFEKDVMKLDATGVENLYKEALEKTKEDIEIIKRYAEWLEQQNRLQDARAMWDKAKVEDKDNVAEYDAKIKAIDDKLNQPQ